MHKASTLVGINRLTLLNCILAASLNTPLGFSEIQPNSLHKFPALILSMGS
jgi:hypothetical protein